MHDLPAGAATWLTWTLGLIETEDATIDEFLIGRVDDANLRLSERIQAIRVLGYRAGASRRTSSTFVNWGHASIQQPQLMH